MMAPIYAPTFMPMGDVIREHITLEAGARGLRSLFSSKPSDKDVQRVKRFGTLAVRVLRAVFAADGPLDVEEGRTLAALIGSLGLSQEDAAPLYNELPIPAEQMDMYGEVEPPLVRALIRGAWHGSAWDTIDPREEHVVRTIAHKLAVQQTRRGKYANRGPRPRRCASSCRCAAATDAIRFVLSDRSPGIGIQLATSVGTLLLPRRHREEVLSQFGHGAKVVLARRYTGIAAEDKATVLGLAWAAGLFEDPTISRRALLRARHDRVASDIGFDGAAVRTSQSINGLPMCSRLPRSRWAADHAHHRRDDWLPGRRQHGRCAHPRPHRIERRRTRITSSRVTQKKIAAFGSLPITASIRLTTTTLLVRRARVLVLSVKPQVVDKVLAEIGAEISGPDARHLGRCGSSDRGARRKTTRRNARRPRDAEYMPATALAGATAISRGTHATDADEATATRLFEAVGKVVTLDESLLDAVTGLSGSGPAYVMLIIEALGRWRREGRTSSRHRVDAGSANRVWLQLNYSSTRGSTRGA